MQSITIMPKEKKMKCYIEECLTEKKKFRSLKQAKTGFRDLHVHVRKDTVFHSGEEQTRKNRQLMMGDKQSVNFTLTKGGC